MAATNLKGTTIAQELDLMSEDVRGCTPYYLMLLEEYAILEEHAATLEQLCWNELGDYLYPRLAELTGDPYWIAQRASQRLSWLETDIYMERWAG